MYEENGVPERRGRFTMMFPVTESTLMLQVLGG
jgi:hypothetical protein